MNVLSIGNSFSEDAHRYLNKIAWTDDKQSVFTWNLTIGGCPLSLHFRNMRAENKAYGLWVNGNIVCTKVSIKEALLTTNWDYISLQQVSRLSFKYETYQPYLNELVAYIKKYCPNAKIILQQTWAYNPKTDILSDMGFSSHDEMFQAVSACYDKAAHEIGAHAVIPSGYTMKTLLKLGVEDVHRDNIHANNVGRFAISATWYQALTGRSLENVDFSHFDFDADVSAEDIEKAKIASLEAVKKYGFEVK
jgi:hypothetical protein